MSKLVLTTFGRQALVTQWFVRDLADATATLYVAYATDIPPANADGSQLSEPNPAAGYARLGLALDSTRWAPSGFGEIFNATEESFPILTADWGYIAGIALVDAAAIGTGNVIATGMVSEPFRTPIGTRPTLEIGALTIGLYE